MKTLITGPAPSILKPSIRREAQRASCLLRQTRAVAFILAGQAEIGTIVTRTHGIIPLPVLPETP
jgi:hypothetical protein